MLSLVFSCFEHSPFSWLFLRSLWLLHFVTNRVPKQSGNIYMFLKVQGGRGVMFLRSGFMKTHERSAVALICESLRLGGTIFLSSALSSSNICSVCVGEIQWQMGFVGCRLGSDILPPVALHALWHIANWFSISRLEAGFVGTGVWGELEYPTVATNHTGATY